jgi:hypothetical protein
MHSKMLLVAGIIASGILLASIALPTSAQQTSDFKFEYEKSGGIAGISEKITFDSKTGVITSDRSTTGTVEKQLSAAGVDSIKQAISQGGFFDMNELYPPKSGVADFFSYSLTVTMGGTTHTVGWVDQWASSAPLPAGLASIVDSIEQALADAPEQSIDPGKRRITETMVRQSASHNAEGHSSHQAAYLLLANPGYVYNGAVTFSATKPVDIMVYHDVTGQNVTGVPVHVVNGRSFAVTTLLKNATAGSMNFVGSGILAHTAAGEQYTIVATVDVLRKVVTGQTKSFVVDVAGEQFVVRATDAQTVQQLTDNYNGKNSMHVTGNVVRGDGGFNQPYSWHLEPASVRMADISIEVCDGRPSYVQENLDEWLDTVGNYCPWASKVVAIK